MFKNCTVSKVLICQIVNVNVLKCWLLMFRVQEVEYRDRLQYVAKQLFAFSQVAETQF